jgi:tyrosyl-tRNA synthetase
MRFHVPHITVESVAMSSELFSSKSDLRRMVDQHSVRLNGVVLDRDDLPSSLELGDFINLFLDGRGLRLAKSFNTHQLILIERGKRTKALLQVDNHGTEVLN